MDNTKIKNFLVLADCLNYTKAAQEIGKSQSVLSRQIASMEEEMGVLLFSRTTKEVALTEAGKVARHWFETIDKQYDVMLTEAKAAQEGYRGVLSFGALAGLRIYFNYSDIINEFMKAYPDIKVSLEALEPKRLEEMLTDGRIDFVMGAAEQYSRRREYRVTVVGKARNGLAIPSTHPLADVPDEKLSIKNFADDTWLLFSVPPVAQTVILRKLDELNISPHVIDVKDIASLAMWLQSDAGVAPLCETHTVDDSHVVMKYIKDMGYIEEAFVCRKYSENPCVAVFEKFAISYINSRDKK